MLPLVRHYANGGALEDNKHVHITRYVVTVKDKTRTTKHIKDIKYSWLVK